MEIQASEYPFGRLCLVCGLGDFHDLPVVALDPLNAISQIGRLAVQPRLSFPRLRALALFGRRSVERVERLVVAGVKKPQQQPTTLVATITT